MKEIPMISKIGSYSQFCFSKLKMYYVVFTRFLRMKNELLVTLHLQP